MNVNKLILGDNLEILKAMDSESVDLVYLDPPFFSNRNYEVIWGDAGEIRSFQDRWSGGIDHYIAWLKERVEQMHRVLKKTGSIFLHCDWHADAYIRVQILDRIFGEKNFRNHIIWKRNSAHNSSDRCGNIHDSIFYYQKTGYHKWNLIYQDYSEQYLDEFFDSVDASGKRYKRADLTGAGTTKGVSGKPWRNIDVKSKGRHWAYVPKELDRLDELGKIHWPQKAGGMPRLKVYPEDMKGVPLQDVWDDIRVIHNLAKERIGYPTQKPEALMRRIIEMASDKDDVVLDPFVGGGTTVAVADKLRRKWIGIDQSTMALKVTDFRLQKQADMFSGAYTVQLHKYDYDTVRNKDAAEFESWIIAQLGGSAHGKKGGDMGIDGKTEEGVPIQVKRSDNISREVVDKFPTAAERYDPKLFAKNLKAKKPVGYIIAFSFSKGAVGEVARLSNDKGMVIKLVRVDEIIPVAPRPSLAVTVNELERGDGGDRRIEFIAKGRSGAGMKFYSWDFDYDEKAGFKPSEVIDNEGRQVLSLGCGVHHIAVKAVDNDGLENTEVVELKINGGVSRH